MGERRRRIGGLVGVLLASGLAACEGPAPSPGDRSSVILITLDTLRADHLGAYGYFRETSPELEALAGEGALFENTFTTMATTLPAHVSLMTSTLTVTHGIKGNAEHLGRSFSAEGGLLTLAEILREAGYRTAALVSAAPLKRHTGIQRGFEHFDEPDAAERRAGEMTDRAIAWLSEHPVGEPYFLWLHYFDPHDPYDPPEPYRGRFRVDDRLRRLFEARGVNPRARVSYSFDPVPVSVATLHNRYDGEIRYLDDQLGRLFRAIRERGSWDETFVVVVGDHGEGLGQHGWIDHGRIYDEQLRVPLIMKPPRWRRAGLRVPRLTSVVDVMPTILGALDVPIPGRDLAQLEGGDLLAGTSPRRSVFAERVNRDRGWEPGRKFALRSLRWKYFYLTEGPDSLFDVEADPYETRNVIDRHPEVAERMREEVLALLAREPGAESRAPRPIPAEVREQLRELGYLE